MNATNMKGSSVTKKCFSERGWVLDRQDGKKATHLLMDGGRLHVPPEDSNSFLQQMATLLAGKHVPSVVELRTPVFRMMMDIDIEHTDPSISAASFSNMLELIREAAFHFWHVMNENAEHVKPRMVVCSAPLKKTSNGNTKLGLHVVFPQIATTPQIASAFRMILLPVLEDRARVPEGMVQPWDKVIDNSVFQSNGLRMPFNGKGRKETRAYVPCMEFLDEDMDVCSDIECAETSVKTYRHWLESCSIRSTTNVTTPLFCKVSALPESVQKLLKTPAGKGGSVDGALSCQRERLADYADLLPKIMEAIPPEYGEHAITSAARFPNFVAFRSTSRFCRNLGRCHRSNNVYFVVSSEGLAQRCYCRCDTLDGRLYSRCMDFQSEFFRIDERVIFEIMRISQNDTIATHDAHQERIGGINKMAMPSLQKHKSRSFDNIMAMSLKPTKKRKSGSKR